MERETDSGPEGLGDAHIEAILQAWPYQPGALSARRVRGADGRELVQLRLDMGLLQMEVEGRPDGERPEGEATYYDFLCGLFEEADAETVLSPEQCEEVDRELVQFYHRRVCWLAVRDFPRACRDADHTLALMDLAAARGPDEPWVLSHEQYRPFVLLHRTQAAALVALEGGGAEAAISAIDAGLQSLESVYAKAGRPEGLDEDEVGPQLDKLKESIRERYDLAPSLSEQLAAAVAAEQYEQAARIRDEMARRRNAPGRRGDPPPPPPQGPGPGPGL